MLMDSRLVFALIAQGVPALAGGQLGVFLYRWRGKLCRNFGAALDQAFHDGIAKIRIFLARMEFAGMSANFIRELK